MKNLRQQVRDTATRGAIVYAVVESTALGHATVRLANQGSRLTNLPVLGAPVKVDDRIIVDYSAEGVPTVRPLTIPTIPEETIPLEEAAIIGKSEPDVTPSTSFELVAGKLTRSYSKTLTFTSSTGRWIPDSFFDTTIFSTHDLYSQASGILALSNYPGTYLIKYSIAMNDAPGVEKAQALIDGILVHCWNRTSVSYGVFRKSNGYPRPVIATATAIARCGPYNPGATQYFDPRLYLAGVPSPYKFPYSITYPVLTNKYPILEWWRIAPWTSTDPKSTPLWWD